MVKIKKRHKSSRYRGSKTHARGFKKKARGSGHRGGVGMSGTGKRGDQKKTLILNLYGNDYFGKDKTLRKGQAKVNLEAINIQEINDNILSMVKQGKAKDNKGFYELSLKGYKVLGEGETKLKLKINADSASKSAIEKIKKAGGEITVRTRPVVEVKEKVEKKAVKK